MAELNTSAEKSGKFRSNRTPVRVDLTAMVDLAFLLITFFMLTTTLQKQEAMPIAMPNKGGPISAGVPMSRTLTVCLGADNKVVSFFGTADAPVSTPNVSSINNNGLRRTLITEKNRIRSATGKDLILILKPSEHSIYNDLVSAIDELNITKVDRYAIVDITPADVKLLKSYKSY